MADGPPLKGCFAKRWERRWGWCEFSGVSGDRFVSGDSPIHLSLTLTPGARGEQSVCGQGKYDPSPLPFPRSTNLQTASQKHTQRKYRSGQRGNLMRASLLRRSVVARVLCHQVTAEVFHFQSRLTGGRRLAWHSTVTGRRPDLNTGEKDDRATGSQMERQVLSGDCAAASKINTFKNTYWLSDKISHKYNK